MSVDVVLLLHVIYSRTIAPVANVFCWLYPTLNKIYLILFILSYLMKNKTKWELSALVSSRSLGERTDVESQINGIYLTWCRHRNTVLGSKRCIRRTQCHQDALGRYVFLSACSCTGSKTISTRANIQMVYKGDASWTSNLHARTSLLSAFSCWASHLLWYDIIFVGKRECISVCPGREQVIWW